jgi:hypothetical protein
MFKYLLILLFPVVAFGQYVPEDDINTDVAFEQPFYLSVRAGVSVPVEDYGQSNVSDSDPGFAQTGYYITGQFETYWKNGLGLFAGVRYNQNPFNENDFGKASLSVNPGFELLSSQSDPIRDIMGEAGIAVHNRLSPDLFFVSRIGMGVFQNTYPGQRVRLENQQGEYVVQSSESQASSEYWTAGFDLHYEMSKSVMLVLNTAYVSGNAEHEEVPQRTTEVATGRQATTRYDIENKLRLFTGGVGIMFLF